MVGMGAVVFAIAGLLLTQEPASLFEKAPPAVDEALRARVAKFFQAHVDGKFRAAAEVVAEDSQDAFYTANKPRYYSFEITRIEYSENFTRAKVVVACEMDHPAPGFAGVKVKAPRTTFWKLEGGQWWYYIDPNQGYQTPFGVMRPGPGAAANPPPGMASGQPPPAPNVDLEKLLSWVKAEKQDLQFSRGKPGEDSVLLTNAGPDTASLRLAVPSMPGFEVTLERKEVPKGETARLTARWQPGEIPPPPQIRVQILVLPTNQVLDLWAKFPPASDK